MKLFGCGFIATTDVTDKDDEIHRVRGTLKIVSDLECNYTILPIWGGVYVKNKCETSTWGYAAAPRTYLLSTGDNTVVYVDNTVSWDGSATSHATLDKSATSSEPCCVACSCRRVVWSEAGGIVKEIQPGVKPVEYKLEYPLPLKITAIAAGAQFTLALGHCGIVWSWGINNHGQLGQGHIEEIKEPTPIDYLGGLQIRSIAAGYWHCLALTEFDVVYAWGWNCKGQLGVTSESNMESEPVTLFDEDSEIKKISCGRSHSAFLDTGGRLYVCGYNKYGQCDPTNTAEELFLNNTLSEDTVLVEGVKDMVCGPWSTYYVTE